MYLSWCAAFTINLDHVIILTASADVRRCAAASAPLRPLPLYCGRFNSTAAASAPLRPLPHCCGRSPHCCGRSPHHCGRSMSESDCVQSMFRSGVHLWATIVQSPGFAPTPRTLQLKNVLCCGFYFQRQFQSVLKSSSVSDSSRRSIKSLFTPHTRRSRLIVCIVAHKCTPLRNTLRTQSDSDIERPQ